jgi:electron-transferring-flavoprotein dehydrogenase
VLIGCSAGMVNVPRIKGSHNAMLSGIAGRRGRRPPLVRGPVQGDELSEYQTAWDKSGHRADLKKVRNVKPLWSKLGLMAGCRWVVSTCGPTSCSASRNPFRHHEARQDRC